MVLSFNLDTVLLVCVACSLVLMLVIALMMTRISFKSNEMKLRIKGKINGYFNKDVYCKNVCMLVSNVGSSEAGIHAVGVKVNDKYLDYSSKVSSTILNKLVLSPYETISVRVDYEDFINHIKVTKDRRKVKIKFFIIDSMGKFIEKRNYQLEKEVNSVINEKTALKDKMMDLKFVFKSLFSKVFRKKGEIA